MSHKPKEVDLTRVKEIYAQTKTTPPTAVTYEPIFDDGVLVEGPNGTPPVSVSENYCLTVPSTMGLMSILADLTPVAYGEYPQIFADGSHFEYSRKVPWVKFSNGAERNAGQLAQYWKANSGDPGGKTAESNARQDIAWG